jgi:hypothetical protein
MPVLVALDHPHRTLADLRGKLGRCRGHDGSILLKSCSLRQTWGGSLWLPWSRRSPRPVGRRPDRPLGIGCAGLTPPSLTVGRVFGCRCGTLRPPADDFGPAWQRGYGRRLVERRYRRPPVAEDLPRRRTANNRGQGWRLFPAGLSRCERAGSDREIFIDGMGRGAFLGAGSDEGLREKAAICRNSAFPQPAKKRFSDVLTQSGAAKRTEPRTPAQVGRYL